MVSTIQVNAWIRLLICGLKWSLTVWEDLHTSDFPLGLQSEFSSCSAERGQTTQGGQCGGAISAVSAPVFMVDSSATTSPSCQPCSAVEPEPSDCCVIRNRESDWGWLVGKGRTLGYLLKETSSVGAECDRTKA